jgi:hypothetical protein
MELSLFWMQRMPSLTKAQIQCKMGQSSQIFFCLHAGSSLARKIPALDQELREVSDGRLSR